MATPKTSKKRFGKKIDSLGSREFVSCYCCWILEDLDGFKYFFDDEAWLLIRPSGTEPVLRTYAESSSSEKAFDILNAVKAVIES